MYNEQSVTCKQNKSLIYKNKRKVLDIYIEIKIIKFSKYSY